MSTDYQFAPNIIPSYYKFIKAIVFDGRYVGETYEKTNVRIDIIDYKYTRFENPEPALKAAIINSMLYAPNEDGTCFQLRADRTLLAYH